MVSINPDKSKQTSKSPPLWKRRSVKIFAGVLLFTLILSFLTPIGIKLYLQKWLIENGADSATIEKVHLNPFTGVAALKGVDVQKDGRTVFGDSSIFVNIGLRFLLGREAYLQKATLSDLVIDIEQDTDTLRVGSYSISSREKDATPAQPLKKQDETLPWIFQAKEIDLTNVKVFYKTPDLDIKLAIDTAHVERFSTNPDDKDGRLLLKGNINGAPVHLDLTTFQVFPEVSLGGTVNISDFQLDLLAQFLGKYLKPFSGTAAIDGLVDFKMNETADIQVAYDGTIYLDKGDIAGDGWATKGTVNWNGKASFSMDEKLMVVDTDGELRALKASFDMPDPVIDIDNSNIGILGKTKVTIGEEVIVDSQASLDLAPTTFAMDILKSSTGDADWQGSVLVETGTQSKGLLVRTDGKLSIAKPYYAMEIEAKQMEVSNETLQYVGKAHY